jgi:hypothetical protein
MGLVNTLIRWWRRRRWTAPRVKHVREYDRRSDVPSDLPCRTLAIVTGSPGWAIFECPCGTAHDRIEVLLSARSDLPAWRLDMSEPKPTLHPSIDSQGERRCHFWLQRGKVLWVPDWE